MPASNFVYRRRILFHETDLAGIVHFSNFFKYMEEAEHAFVRSIGLSIHPPEELREPARARMAAGERVVRFQGAVVL